MNTKKPVILFDDICNLCNNSVQYVIKHDSKNIYQFAALQSQAGQALLQKYKLPTTHFNSFLLIQNNNVYQKSTAALMVAKQLSGAIKLIYIFIIVPAFIRNAVYNFIAKNRYKWFGKKDSCMIPNKLLQDKFLK